MDIGALTGEAAARRAALVALEPDDGWLNEFDLFCAWVGRRWSRERYLVWMVGVDLVDPTEGSVEYAEHVVRRRRWHSEWSMVQSPKRAFDAAENFVRDRFTVSND